MNGNPETGLRFSCASGDLPTDRLRPLAGIQRTSTRLTIADSKPFGRTPPPHLLVTVTVLFFLVLQSRFGVVPARKVAKFYEIK